MLDVENYDMGKKKRKKKKEIKKLRNRFKLNRLFILSFIEK